jgi:hypothetical protein
MFHAKTELKAIANQRRKPEKAAVKTQGSWGEGGRSVEKRTYPKTHPEENPGKSGTQWAKDFSDISEDRSIIKIKVQTG